MTEEESGTTYLSAVSGLKELEGQEGRCPLAGRRGGVSWSCTDFGHTPSGMGYGNCVLTRMANTEMMNGTNSERTLSEQLEFSLSRVGALPLTFCCQQLLAHLMQHCTIPEQLGASARDVTDVASSRAATSRAAPCQLDFDSPHQTPTIGMGGPGIL
eukprot:1305043-Rhodomonas_salina.2